MEKNIYLVGFMGTGKTTVAKILSRTLGMNFAEMDELIEEEEGISISDIFAQKGETYFRALEKEAVRKLSKKSNYVVSCGGGVVIDKENVTLLKRTGVVVCLTAAPGTIYERTKAHTHRPLLNVPDPIGAITTLLEKRTPYYKEAHVFIDTDTVTADEVARNIAAIIKNKEHTHGE